VCRLVQSSPSPCRASVPRTLPCSARREGGVLRRVAPLCRAQSGAREDGGPAGGCKWSSYRATAGREVAPQWLDVAAAVAWLGVDRADAQTAYRHHVLAAIDCEDRLWDKVTNAIYLGGERWTKQMRKVVESRPRSTDHPKTQRAVGRPRMHTIVKTVANVATRLQDAIRPISSAQRRRLMARIGWHEGLITLRGIAARPAAEERRVCLEPDSQMRSGVCDERSAARAPRRVAGGSPRLKNPAQSRSR
ncbi:MAG: hypothetical protein JWO56_2447, partial [Acidobacteria bacterium]|nr:hypothetical protein [Acidobacteriota bacterium]